MTCLFINASKVKANTNSIFLPTDVIVSFKGSSTMDNFKHDLMSQFSASDIAKLVLPTGVKIQNSGLVTGSFIGPIVNAWAALMKAMNEHVKANDTRLFLTGHSLGGAYTSLFAYILAEGKVSGSLPIMNKVKSIHIVSFGAPCILRDNARTSFNKHLDSGLVTLDRVVSQSVPARSAATQVLVGGLAGPNDVIPTIPVGFAHPGYRPLANPLKNVYPESKGRPYSIDFVRKFYGVPTKTRYREPTSWPFPESLNLGDHKFSGELKNIVTGLTGVAVIPEDVEPQAPTGAPAAPTNAGDPQVGGGPDKNIYEKATLQRIPNFVSVQGSAYAMHFAHAEYLGMFFFGGFRLPGMKNPATKNVAYFELGPSGVKILYTAPGATATNFTKNLSKGLNASVSANENPTNPVSGGRRRTRALNQRKRRFTRRR